MRFAGKNVVITGGSSGIGLATARRVCAEGGRVLITGTNRRRIEEARALLPEGSVALANDAADPAAAAALAEAAQEAFGRVDALFLNAGFGGFGDNQAIEADEFDKMSNVNVRGPVLQLAKLIPGAERRRLGRGHRFGLALSRPGQAAVYAATKGAVTAITRSWAADLAPAQHPRELDRAGPDRHQFRRRAEPVGRAEAGIRPGHLKQVPLNRFGTAEEVAAVPASCCRTTRAT
jgi:NAD(P)-dependent dehydrogenase (short-subunit alcohol dehydrogenase family)